MSGRPDSSRGVLQLPLRLASSVRRNGVGKVAAFGVSMLRERGMQRTFRYAALTASERVEAYEQDATSQGAAVAPRVKTDLDGRYGLPESRWRRMMADAREAAPANADAPVEPVELVLQVNRAGAAPEALRVTTESFAAASAPRAETGRPPGVEVNKYVLLLEAGDRVEQGLAAALKQEAARSELEVATFDLVEVGHGRAQPLFLPGANPTLALNVDYMRSRLIFRQDVLASLPQEAGAHGALLAWLERRRTPAQRRLWRHLSGGPFLETPIFEPSPQEQALQAEPMFRFTPAPSPAVAGRVGIVICTKDKGRLLRQLLRAIDADANDRISDVVILANNTGNPVALTAQRDAAASEKVTVLRRDGAFNFSRLSNEGARLSGGDFLLFLNDDITPVTDRWLEDLLAPFIQNAVGVTGPLLLYPDERVQHAGMYLGYKNTAGHTLRGAALPEDDYMGLASTPRDVSAVTGAAMMVSRACFEALGGFDEQLATYLQDVDFCLRARRSGFDVVFNPASVLLHMESASMKSLAEDTPLGFQRGLENLRFHARWGERLVDPLHGQGFHPDDERLRTLAPHFRARNHVER